MSRSRRNRLVAGMAVLAVVCFFFLFVRAVPQSASGQVGYSAVAQAQAPVTLPGSTTVTVHWHTLDASLVDFQVLSPSGSNVKTYRAVAFPADHCGFDTGQGGTFSLVVEPIRNDAGANPVSYTLNYNAPEL
jgi:hypothetical protein